MRRVIIATLIATTASVATSGAVSAAPRNRTVSATGAGDVFTVGGGIEDLGSLSLAAPIRRSASTTWSYDATTTFTAGTGCPTSIGTCYAASGTLTLGDGTSNLTATIAGTDDASAAFVWTATITGGTGDWRRARGVVRVSGTRDWVNGQWTVSDWDLTDLNL